MAREKIGRNDPCPCGSGQKFKKCCFDLRAQTISMHPAVPPATQEAHNQLLRRKLEQERNYGRVRPIIHADWRGKRLIAIGDQLLASDQWKTFTDFLFDYIIHILTPAWGNAELLKPLEQRHFIMQWYNAVCEFQKIHVKTPGEIAKFAPNGPFAAYFHLAYDLYLLNHHQRLQQLLLDRLKDPKKFQGARYELFAIATGIRAGFAITFEDETDNSTKHPEYVATHPLTGQQLAIECKSRHRPSVLGFPGSSTANYHAGVQGLVSKAAGKLKKIPFVLFLDVNLPASDRPIFEMPWVGEVMDHLCDRAEERYQGKDPFNMVIVTNFPHHYGEPSMPDPTKARIAMLAKDPLIPIAHPTVLHELWLAVEQYGNIPQQFSDVK